MKAPIKENTDTAIFKFLTVTHNDYFDLSYNFQEKQGRDARM